jgi:hypothetical protein
MKNIPLNVLVEETYGLPKEKFPKALYNGD